MNDSRMTWSIEEQSYDDLSGPIMCYSNTMFGIIGTMVVGSHVIGSNYHGRATSFIVR